MQQPANADRSSGPCRLPSTLIPLAAMNISQRRGFKYLALEETSFGKRDARISPNKLHILLRKIKKMPLHEQHCPFWQMNISHAEFPQSTRLDLKSCAAGVVVTSELSLCLGLILSYCMYCNYCEMCLLKCLMLDSDTTINFMPSEELYLSLALRNIVRWHYCKSPCSLYLIAPYDYTDCCVWSHIAGQLELNAEVFGAETAI